MHPNSIVASGVVCHVAPSPCLVHPRTRPPPHVNHTAPYLPNLIETTISILLNLSYLMSSHLSSQSSLRGRSRSRSHSRSRDFLAGVKQVFRSKSSGPSLQATVPALTDPALDAVDHSLASPSHHSLDLDDVSPAVPPAHDCNSTVADNPMINIRPRYSPSAL